MSEQLATEIEHSTVSHQFEDPFQQKEAATLGMWTFLATEVLFFGAIFVSYTIYRHMWPEAFRQGSLNLKWYMGAVNTAVLLMSSFTMAIAVHAAALGDNRMVVRFLILTIIIGGVFLCIKGCEYYIEYQEHLVPALNFSREPASEEQMSPVGRGFEHFDQWLRNYIHPIRKSETRPQSEELFFLFYFIMTAIHATHMIIGIGIMLVLIFMAKRGMFSKEYHNPVENFGLYWHFVDIVWVFLFPTLYLLRNP